MLTKKAEISSSAGLRVCANEERHIPLLTDRTSLIKTSDRIIWVNNNSKIIPGGVKAMIDFSTTSSQLREVEKTFDFTTKIMFDLTTQ